MQVSGRSSTSAILVLPARLMPAMRLYCFNRAACRIGHFTACQLSETFCCRALQHQNDAHTVLQGSGIPERKYSRRSALNMSSGVEQPSGLAMPSTGGTRSGPRESPRAWRSRCAHASALHAHLATSSVQSLSNPQLARIAVRQHSQPLLMPYTICTWEVPNLCSRHDEIQALPMDPCLVG